MNDARAKNPTSVESNSQLGITSEIMEALICLFLPVYMPVKVESASLLGSGLHPLTVLEVSMGGLSLMSVTVMMAVAVLDRPKFRLPSMSVACTMMVYWETFCGRCQHTAAGYLFIPSSAGTAPNVPPERAEEGPSGGRKRTPAWFAPSVLGLLREQLMGRASIER